VRKSQQNKAGNVKVNFNINTMKELETKTNNTKHKFSDAIYQKYLDTVNSSEILLSEENKDIPSDDLEKKLHSCKLNAKIEFRYCHSKIVELFEKIIQIENQITDDIEKLEKTNPEYKATWEKIFKEFNFQLSQIFNYANDKLISSFEQKVNQIEYFTICLFGRTKVGKSTTMEALTKGKGTTIGIGRQNTTVEIKEYRWKGLKVVDTPGIDAMDKIDELEDLAVSFADSADLIVFLLPHQIKKGDFEKFKQFYKQNKPVIILLNVKAATGELGSEDLYFFLNETAKELYEEDKINGYKSRIEELIFNTLKINKSLIPIIPIHSKSAFLSTQINEEEVSRQLNAISNFDVFKSRLINEVKDFGELYRIKNPYDTLSLFADTTKEKLIHFHSYLTEQKILFDEYIDKYSILKTQLIQNRNKVIAKRIVPFFKNKKKEVHETVDELFSKKKEAGRIKILQDFMKEYQLVNIMKSTIKEINKDIKKEITSFFSDFEKELSKLNFERQRQQYSSSTESKIDGIEDMKFKRSLVEGASLVTGVLGSVGLAVVALDGSIVGAEGTLFGLGGANVWNPVGWALIAAGVVLGVVGIFMTKKQKQKIKEAKEKAAKELTKAINKTETEVTQRIKKAVNDTIKAIERSTIDVMKEYSNYSCKHLESVSGLVLDIENLIQNSSKQKFQKMLDNILNSSNINVENIYQSGYEINIVLNFIPQCDKDIIDILSRVEEKQIILTSK